MAMDQLAYPMCQNQKQVWKWFEARPNDKTIGRLRYLSSGSLEAKKLWISIFPIQEPIKVIEDLWDGKAVVATNRFPQPHTYV